MKTQFRFVSEKINGFKSLQAGWAPWCWEGGMSLCLAPCPVASWVPAPVSCVTLGPRQGWAVPVSIKEEEARRWQDWSAVHPGRSQSGGHQVWPSQTKRILSFAPKLFWFLKKYLTFYLLIDQLCTELHFSSVFVLFWDSLKLLNCPRWAQTCKSPASSSEYLRLYIWLLCLAARNFETNGWL